MYCLHLAHANMQRKHNQRRLRAKKTRIKDEGSIAKRMYLTASGNGEDIKSDSRAGIQPKIDSFEVI